MSSTWIIGLLILGGLLLFFKLSPGARFGKTWTYGIAIIMIFLVATFGYVLTRPEVFENLNSLDGIAKAFNIYLSWIGNLADNAVSITGNAIKTDWLANVTEGA